MDPFKIVDGKMVNILTILKQNELIKLQIFQVKKLIKKIKDVKYFYEIFYCIMI